MNKTKIEYCTHTWNPVTGCYHDYNYCYARRIAERFGGNDKAENCGICGDCPKDTCLKCTDYVQISKIHELDFPKRVFYPRKQNLPYPYSFEPTFYKYKIDEPKKLKKTFKNICKQHGRFLSIEPLQGPLYITYLNGYDWVIVGAETGNRKNKIIPKKEWIERIVEQCKKYDIPVFMKDSLIPIVGEGNMLREFPEGLR